jgi:hypothetical protein
MSDKTLLAITHIMSSVSDAIGAAQEAALEPTSDASVATWHAIVGRLRTLLSDSCPCDCGEAGCVPCMIVNALGKARDHLDALVVGSGPQAAYHTRFAVENLETVRTLARDELRRAAAPTR